MLLVILALLGIFLPDNQPFSNADRLGNSVSVVFYPVYAFICRYIKVKAIASSITVLLVFVVIIAPITYISFLLIEELQLFGTYMNSGGLEFVRTQTEQLKVSPFFSKLISFISENDVPTADLLMDNVKKIER